MLHTDSQFLISCITVWIHKWKRNGWKLSDGGLVKNKEDLTALVEALQDMSVKWVCKATILKEIIKMVTVWPCKKGRTRIQGREGN